MSNTRRGGGRHNAKYDADRPTDGEWTYHPTWSRLVMADDGTYLCRVFGGLRSRHNGPIFAAAKDTAIATALLLDAVKRMEQGEDVPDFEARVAKAEAALEKAKGGRGEQNRDD